MLRRVFIVLILSTACRRQKESQGHTSIHQSARYWWDQVSISVNLHKTDISCNMPVAYCVHTVIKLCLLSVSIKTVSHYVSKRYNLSAKEVVLVVFFSKSVFLKFGQKSKLLRSTWAPTISTTWACSISLCRSQKAALFPCLWYVERHAPPLAAVWKAHHLTC